MAARRPGSGGEVEGERRSGLHGALQVVGGVVY